MHLSPVKGAFPHKDQHDRTAPVAEGNEIQRGSVIRIKQGTDGVGRWELAENADVFPMYLALQPNTDLQAAMAGQFSPANGKKEDHPFPYTPGSWKRATTGKYGNEVFQGGIEPAISGIHMDDGDVWETDMFDATADWDTAEINAKLTVANGLITCTGATEDNCVGFLVKAPYTRYCNDAPAVKGMMTGASRWVIQFQCGK